MSLMSNDAGGRFRHDGHDEAGHRPPAERGEDATAGPDAGSEGFGDAVVEGPVDGNRENDLGEHGHFLPRSAITFCMSSQTWRLSSLFPSLRTR